MERSYPDWENLPVEILWNILHFAGLHGDLPDPSNAQYISSQVTLVCKAWRNSTLPLFYSHVNITSLSQLRKFHDVVKYNTRIGTMVKVLDLQKCYIAESQKKLLLAIVTHLLSSCLPNLVSLSQDMHPSYLPTLNALLDSKLKNLKSIRSPTYPTDGDELVHYVSCVFLMRERLQEVYISNGFFNSRKKNINELAVAKFQHLYDNLNQFNNLTKIHITRQTDDGVQVLEHIVETCRSLRDINLNLSSINNQHDNIQLKNDIDLNMTLHYKPRYNIKTLTICLSMTPIDNCKILLYIMKKFPSLEKLDLTHNGTYVEVTPTVLTQLLNYSATIKEGNFSNLTTSPDDIFTTIGNLWNTSSKPGVENVIFSYSNDHIEAESTFFIQKIPDQGTKILLSCPLELFNRQPHVYLIEKNGKLIGDLTFQFGEEHCDMPDNFLIHIFTHCPNLRNLRIDKSKLHKCSHSKFDATKKYSIDEFTLRECEITPGILNQLSTVLSEVKQLRLIDTDCLDDNDDDIDSCNTSYINMPQTKIQRIILGLIIEDEPVYVKLFVVMEQKYYYYQSHADTDSIESSESRTKIGTQIDEKVYDEGGNYADFYVCCQTKPEIIFEYSTY